MKLKLKLKQIIYYALILIVVNFQSCRNTDNNSVQNKLNNSVARQDWAIVVHGGAGTMSKDKMTPGMEKEYRASLQEAMNVGKKILSGGGSALDKNGNLAAGTSTGGMANKRYNRVGDAPIIGAGTYANNNTCAVSATGHGEFFIRWTVAHDISALMEYKGLSLKEASELVVNDKLVKAGGIGGVICVDKLGNISMPFNSQGMFRAFATADGGEGVFIFKDEVEK